MLSNKLIVGVVMCCLLLTACSPRVAQPPPLEELDVPLSDDTGYEEYEATGPAGFEDPLAGSIDDWDALTGEQPITDRPAFGEWTETASLQVVYFDYDKYELSADARRTLVNNVDYLIRNPRMRVLLEGHCDERGTEQYNQALGENRALAVREYMIQLGVDPSRIDIISYGELRPAVEGMTESAWRFNRRVEYKVASF